MTALTFCELCSTKRIKDVKAELEKLFSTRHHNPNYCAICHVQLCGSLPGTSDDMSDDDVETGAEHVEGTFDTVEVSVDAPVEIKRHYVDPSMVTNGLDTRVIELLDPTDDPAKPFKCKLCQKGCAKIFNFLRHLKIQHKLDYLQEKPYSCDYCLERFTCFTKVQVHLETHAAEDDKFFKCEVCGSALKTIYSYRRHMRILHNSEKNCPCRYCGKLFRDMSEIKSHEVIHIDKRPYKCDRCERAFRKPGRLKAHQRIHEGVKPYTCSFCNHKLRDKVSLSTHIKKHHTGPRRYSCDECAFKSFLKRDLRLHKKMTHVASSSVVPKGQQTRQNVSFECTKVLDGSMQSETSVVVQLVEETDSTVHTTTEIDKATARPDEASASTEASGELPPETLAAISKLLQHADDSSGINQSVEEVIYHCIDCGYQSGNVADMRIHMSEHLQGNKIETEPAEKEKEFVTYRCSDCGFGCFSVADMNNHISSSDQQQPERGDIPEGTTKHDTTYQCDKCDFKCANSTDLRIHQASHISVRTSASVKQKTVVFKHSQAPVDPPQHESVQAGSGVNKEQIECNMESDAAGLTEATSQSKSIEENDPTDSPTKKSEATSPHVPAVESREQSKSVTNKRESILQSEPNAEQPEATSQGKTVESIDQAKSPTTKAQKPSSSVSSGPAITSASLRKSPRRSTRVEQQADSHKRNQCSSSNVNASQGNSAGEKAPRAHPNTDVQNRTQSGMREQGKRTVPGDEKDAPPRKIKKVLVRGSVITTRRKAAEIDFKRMTYM